MPTNQERLDPRHARPCQYKGNHQAFRHILQRNAHRQAIGIRHAATRRHPDRHAFRNVVRHNGNHKQPDARRDDRLAGATDKYLRPGARDLAIHQKQAECAQQDPCTYKPAGGPG